MVAAGCQPKTTNEVAMAEVAIAEVAMACKWVLYESQKESFVFNLDKKEVYWVNENRRYPISEINEGRIIFEGVRSSLLIGHNQYQEDVPIKFIVNRVTGELYIEGIEIPSGYNNVCVITDKKF